MRLIDGPGALHAGPFPAQVGTPLAPGESAPVAVVLDDRLPDGPWKVELTLESGRVHHRVTGTLIFPGKPASWGTSMLIDSPRPWTFIVIGLIAAIALAVLVLLALRLSRRYQRRIPA